MKSIALKSGGIMWEEKTPNRIGIKYKYITICYILYLSFLFIVILININKQRRYN